MRRSTFLILYLAGVLLQQVASPWVVIGHLAAAPEQFALTDVVTLCMPLLLVAISYRRGQAIGNPRLALWPAAALVASGLPYFIGWTQMLLTQGPVDWSSLPAAWLALLGGVGVGVPLLLHLACVHLGCEEPQVARAAA
jgi:hypothetical protein